MVHLIAASLIWAFSFGIIKRYLGGLDPLFTAWARLTLSSLIFLPFLRLRTLKTKKGLLPHLALAGALEYGVMYIAYLNAYRFLPAWQVALFTVFTPLAVWALHELYAGTFRLTRALPVALAVIGAGWLSFREFDGSASLMGFLLVQLSNLCFAWGQIHYRFTVRRHQLTPQDERSLFGILYLAGFALTALPAGFLVDWTQTRITLQNTPTAWAALLYSGIIASGLAFFLWNRGATQAPPSTLAVLNNLKAPLAIAVALLVFGEQADITRLALAFLILGLGALTSLWIERRPQPKG